MASQKAPVKVTGGGGFGFADRVGALFLAQMLSGGFPLGVRHGTIAKIHFEARDGGWLLDDLLLELSAADGPCHCALSLKSNAQVTQSGFPDSFTSAIWEQTRQTSPRVFNRDRDLLVLGVGRLAAGISVAWDQLLAQALEAEPERLLERLKEEGQSSEVQRDLFASLHCPSSICPDGLNELETAQLLRCLRLIAWDFESAPSNDESKAIEICRSALAQGETERAISLWGELQKIAADGRATGASYDLRGLLNKLRGHYDLKDHPDFQPDWKNLAVVSQESRSLIKREIGQQVRMARATIRKDLDKKIAGASVIGLIGEPGSGKSSLVASVTEQNPTVPLIWLDHTQFDNPNHTALARALNLRFSLPQLIINSGSSHGLIVLDSVETFSTQARRLAAELIKLIIDIPGGTWQVLITCQTHMWEYALREFVDAGVQPKQIATLEITPPGPYEAIQAITAVAPRIVPLLTRPELQRVLCNLKVLDWLVTEDTLRTSGEAYSFVGETDVVAWIWNRWIGHGSNKHARAAVLIKLGEHDGNSLAPAVNILDLSDDERRTLGELEHDDHVRVRQNRASFKHDLLGDWARLQSLLTSSPDALARIRQVAQFPRWQRAVRLYAQHILEHEDGSQRWKAALTAFQGKEPNDVLAADSFLDALIFAGNAEALLEQAWPDLIFEKGQLLRRLLKRFLSIATVPDPRAAAVAEAEDLDWLSIRLRIPFVWYWYAPLRVLDKHHADVARLALVLAAELCELWLRTIPAELGGRPEAARLAIRLAREVQGLRAEDVWFQDNSDQKVYEALCQAAADFPDEVSQILLELCHRRDESSEVTARATAWRAVAARGPGGRADCGRVAAIRIYIDRTNPWPEWQFFQDYMITEMPKDASPETIDLRASSAFPTRCPRGLNPPSSPGPAPGIPHAIPIRGAGPDPRTRRTRSGGGAISAGVVSPYQIGTQFFATERRSRAQDERAEQPAMADHAEQRTGVHCQQEASARHSPACELDFYDRTRVATWVRTHEKCFLL